jgi:hypothetical protein
LRPGDLLLVRHGETVPADGRPEDATATLDESALTGEPMPVEPHQAARLRSGGVYAGGAFRLRAERDAAGSTYAAILRLTEEAAAARAHEGLKVAVTRVLRATWQRCRVHFVRNALAHAGKAQPRIVSAWIGTAYAQEDAAAAHAQWHTVADQLRPKVPTGGSIDPAQAYRVAQEYLTEFGTSIGAHHFARRGALLAEDAQRADRDPGARRRIWSRAKHAQHRQEGYRRAEAAIAADTQDGLIEERQRLLATPLVRALADAEAAVNPMG